MRVSRTGAVLASMFALPCAASAADQVDRYIQAQMQRDHVPAAAVAIVRDGKIIKLATYGTADVEQGVAAGEHSAFQFASATKLFTSIVVMQFAAEGKLDLDAPVSRYLDDAPPEWSTMTLRHLISHTSGLPRVAAPPALATPADAVAFAKQQKLAARPGEVAAYGSVDFSIVAHVLEKLSGKPLEELLAERVLGPLGMADTRFSRFEFSRNHDIVQHELVPRRVNTYEWKGGKQYSYRYLYPAYTFAAGGAFTSIHDAAAFLQAVDSGKLLDRATLQQMWEPRSLANGRAAPFAVGWTRAAHRGVDEVGHSGGPALADVRYYPSRRLGVIVLTNQRALMPVLARGVAGMFLPPAPFLAEKGIADNDPSRTAAFRKVLDQFAAGRADPALFEGEMKTGLADVNAALEQQLGAVPPLTGLVLVETSADNRVRTYRSLHGKDDSLRWVVRFGQGALVADLDVVDE